jgi:hypothetical protein
MLPSNALILHMVCVQSDGTEDQQMAQRIWSVINV